MTAVSRHGISLDTPPGWDVRLYRRAPAPGQTTYPVLHTGNFGLPSLRGDFGSGAVERMGPANVLVVLFEHAQSAAGTPLFASRVRPRPMASDFHPRRLQRIIEGQSGAEYFYTEAGRAFCLYVVLGSHARRASLAAEAATIVAGLRIQPGMNGWRR